MALRCSAGHAHGPSDGAGPTYLDRVRPTADEPHNERLRTICSPSGTLRSSAIIEWRIQACSSAAAAARQFPDLVVDLDLTDQLMDLSSDDIDIAIRVTSPPERAIARRLNSNNYVLVAVPAYLEARGTPRRGGLRPSDPAYRGPDRIIYWQAKMPVGGQRSTQTRLSFTPARNWSPKPRPERTGAGPGRVVKEQVAEKRLILIQLEDAMLALSRTREPTYLIYQQPTG